MRFGIFFAAFLLLWAASSGAQDAPESTPTPTSSGAELLDDAPNLGEVLHDQWTSGLPADADEAARTAAYFGRLVDSGPDHSITLRESVALALQNNTRLQISRLDPLAAAAGVRQARSVFDPEFFAAGSKVRRTSPFASVGVFTSGGVADPTPAPQIAPTSFNQDVAWSAGLRKTILSGGQLSLEWTNNRSSAIANVVNLLVPQYDTTLGVSLNQPLLRDFGWRFALLRVEVAQNTEEQAYQEYKAVIADIVLQVEAAYWGLVTAIDNVQVEAQGLELAEELLRQNEGRFKVGALARTAVLEAQAELARRQTDMVGARNRESNARDQLRAVINSRDPSSDMLLMVQPADEPTVVKYSIDLASSLDSARKNRPELAAARLNVRGSKITRKIAQNQLLPRLDFVGSIGLNGLGGDAVPVPTPGAVDPTRFSEANKQVTGGYGRALHLLSDGRFYQYAVGAQLEVPIGNAQAKADYAQAKIETERAWLVLQELEENITVEVKRAVTNLESLQIGIESARIARELAAENLRNQQARYDVGLATTKDLLDFQDRLTQERARELAVLTGHRTALAQLRRAEGTLLEYRDITVERREPESPRWWARF